MIVPHQSSFDIVKLASLKQIVQLLHLEKDSEGPGTVAAPRHVVATKEVGRIRGFLDPNTESDVIGYTSRVVKVSNEQFPTLTDTCAEGCTSSKLLWFVDYR
ncbi:hypothetical protein HPB47_027394 [Ixodes persulcatus]|uniref:Uncharacterized protein n=1 Tax=Ixodes persulcatus TaxID=34615 RepID=A0AC60PXG0_IXOPE|nr:hypothetical protein HPB47_027394 [Ixodes persulcatus]